MASLRALRRGRTLARRILPGPTKIVIYNREFFALVSVTLGEAEQASFVAQTQQQRFASAVIAMGSQASLVQALHGASLSVGARGWADDFDGTPSKLLATVFTAARRAADSGRRGSAVNLLKAITEAKPSDASGWLQLYELYSSMGRPKDARNAYNGWRKAQGNAPYLAELRPSTPSRFDLAGLKSMLTERFPGAGGARELHTATLERDVTTAGRAAVAIDGLASKQATERVAQLVLRETLAQDVVTEADADLAAAYADSRSVQRASLVPGDVGALKTMDLPALRRYLEGRSVALVANSGRIASSGLGPQIDAYDIVARFNSFAIDAPHTGTRTSIHATIHLHDFNWEVPVDVRLVFGGDQRTWNESIRRFLLPDKQEWIGDESLRWPVRSDTVVGDELAPGVPTSGFNLMRTIDFLDVSPVIDLIGFDFNASGAYRTAAAMKLPVGTQHKYDYEKEWVEAHTVSRNDWRISLR